MSASWRARENGTLYIGHTENLINRTREHKDHVRKGFTAKYGVTMLVWYEVFDTREEAFFRERRMKKWNRAWKIELIERFNPSWADLIDDPNTQKTLGPRFRGDEREVEGCDQP